MLQRLQKSFLISGSLSHHDVLTLHSENLALSDVLEFRSIESLKSRVFHDVSCLQQELHAQEVLLILYASLLLLALRVKLELNDLSVHYIIIKSLILPEQGLLQVVLQLKDLLVKRANLFLEIQCPLACVRHATVLAHRACVVEKYLLEVTLEVAFAFLPREGRALRLVHSDTDVLTRLVEGPGEYFP